MFKLNKILIMAIFCSSSAFAEWAPNRSAYDSKSSQDSFAERANDILVAGATREMPEYVHGSGPGFVVTALMKLLNNKEVDVINQKILDPKVKVYSEVGSDFDRLGPFCKRIGDYDFALKHWVVFMNTLWDRPDLLWPETKHKILHQLLNTTGNKVRTKVKFWRGVCGVLPETENHILQTETSRLLTNELLMREAREQGRTLDPVYDNTKNGMNDWMLRHLQQFAINDFSEYNAKPYQILTIHPIQNIANYAEDVRLRTAAKIVLNYLATKYILSSQHARRFVPFRRQERYLNNTEFVDTDRLTHWMYLHLGDFYSIPGLKGEMQTEVRMAGDAIQVALGSYRLPQLLLDLYFDKNKKDFLTIRHSAVEIFSRSNEFLITSGGVFKNYFDFGTGENNGWAVATTLMTENGKFDLRDLIRIEGDSKPRKRVNTCVAPGFACGERVRIPAAMEACAVKVGAWSFIDLSSQACGAEGNVYVAVFRNAKNDIGFFEARSANETSFAKFQSKILEFNQNFVLNSRGQTRYINSEGKHIVFKIYPDKDWKWPVESFDGVPTQTDITKWSLARGQFMNSPKPGLIEVLSADKTRTLVMDYTNWANPTISYR